MGAPIGESGKTSGFDYHRSWISISGAGIISQPLKLTIKDGEQAISPKITIAAADSIAVAQLCRQALGMTDQRSGLDLGTQQAHLNFLQKLSLAVGVDDFLKIGITMTNLEVATDYITLPGWQYQFRDNLIKSIIWRMAWAHRVPL